MLAAPEPPPERRRSTSGGFFNRHQQHEHEHHADYQGPDVVARPGTTLLHQYVNLGDVGNIDRLLSRAPAELINTPDEIGRTALHLAALGGQVVTMRLLLQNRADPNARTRKQLTPLHFAAKGYTECVVLLIQAGAQVSARSESQMSPIHVAAHSGSIACLRELLRFKSQPDSRTNTQLTPLMIAAQYGHRECIRELIKWGARVDARDDKKCAPLHFAAAQGDVGCCDDLIRSGAQVNAGDQAKQTALHIAAHLGNIEVIRLLIRAGGRVDLRDAYGHAPLQRAMLARQQAAADEFLALTGEAETIRSTLSRTKSRKNVVEMQDMKIDRAAAAAGVGTSEPDDLDVTYVRKKDEEAAALSGPPTSAAPRKRVVRVYINDADTYSMFPVIPETTAKALIVLVGKKQKDPEFAKGATVAERNGYARTVLTDNQIIWEIMNGWGPDAIKHGGDATHHLIVSAASAAPAPATAAPSSGTSKPAPAPAAPQSIVFDF